MIAAGQSGAAMSSMEDIFRLCCGAGLPDLLLTTVAFFAGADAGKDSLRLSIARVLRERAHGSARPPTLTSDAPVVACS